MCSRTASQLVLGHERAHVVLKPSRISRRSAQELWLQCDWASRALLTASSTSSAVHLGTDSSGSPVAGLSTSTLSRSPQVTTRPASSRSLAGPTRSDLTRLDAEADGEGVQHVGQIALLGEVGLAQLHAGSG